jgi:hypothetical protein
MHDSPSEDSAVSTSRRGFLKQTGTIAAAGATLGADGAADTTSLAFSFTGNAGGAGRMRSADRPRCAASSAQLRKSFPRLT